MAEPIEDYALLSDLHTGAIISRRGSIDWLCLPRFDSPSVFAALLGTQGDGCWSLGPQEPSAVVRDRRYAESTFVLETTWETPTGSVHVTDFMPLGERRSAIIRRITGLKGMVTMRHRLGVVFAYATVVPWMRIVRENSKSGNREVLVAMAGPDAVAFRGPHSPAAVRGGPISSDFPVMQGETVDLELSWFPSHRDVPDPVEVATALTHTKEYWANWAGKCNQTGEYAGAVRRSLLVLRALTDDDTGGIVAAPTTSLPEEFGGTRNWDYRYCWLRDAALTLEAMLTHGYASEALIWRNWLLRAIAGDPNALQIMYGLAGERNLAEYELPNLSGYENSSPVRIGNGAFSQYQADVVGEVMVALEKLRAAGGIEDQFSWPLQCALLQYATDHLTDMDHGIWEMRGDLKYFTHSRVMMWAAFDSGVRAVREHGLPGPATQWEQLREELRAEIMTRGFNPDLNSFTQTYDSRGVDASLLIIPQVGFLPYDSPQMLGTVSQLEKELIDHHGLVLRYVSETGVDGLEPGEHPFLACSFWLVEQYGRSGRVPEAETLLRKLIKLSNEVGLLSEEYSTSSARMAGNFPQAFSHLALVRAVDALEKVTSGGPSRGRFRQGSGGGLRYDGEHGHLG